MIFYMYRKSAPRCRNEVVDSFFHSGIKIRPADSTYVATLTGLAWLLSLERTEGLSVGASIVRSFARALPNRDITVPIGQFRMLAIS